MAGDTNLPAGVTLVDGFPFDSSPNLVFTDQGYPRGDRSVDAWVMQRVFKQFFSNGVFGTPANALQINKGTSGLTVTIQPGMFIIDGAMGGVKASDGPLTLTLDTGAARGNVCYGIMLRYDNNPNMRGLGFRVVKGTAGANPQPPAPDTTSENVYELRLGYVTVSNGATDLTNATVHNEKGLDVCPYAAPFEDIDLSDVVHDALVEADKIIARLDEDANTSLKNVQQLIADNIELIKSALDGTTAGHLQNQIDLLRQSSVNSESLNQNYLAMQKESPDADALLGLVESSVGIRELQNHAVTMEKLSQDVTSTMATKSDVADVAADVAILTFNASVGSIVADQKMDNVFIWEFPDDVDAGDTPYNSGSDSYYVNGV